MFLAIAVVLILLLYRFEFSRIGTTLRALAQSQDVASSIGVNATFYRLLAVGAGSFCAGVAGAAYGLYSTVLSPTNYDMTFSLWLLMYMLIGGEDYFIGPIIGAIIFVLIPELGRGLSAYAPFLTGICTLIVAYLLPGGLAGIPNLIRRRKAQKALRLPKGGTTMHLLETSGLTKRFGGLTVMNDLDFSLEEGEIKGFLGPNRCRKIHVL